MQYVIGIDPGRKTAIAVFRDGVNNWDFIGTYKFNLKAINWFSIKVILKRLKQILIDRGYKENEDLIQFYIEDQYLNKNVHTLKNLVRTRTLLEAGVSEIFNANVSDIKFILPTVWGKIVKTGGQVRMQKKKITKLYFEQLLGVQLSEDEADACGIALGGVYYG